MSYTLSRYSMFQNYCRFDCSCDKLKNATYVLKILQTTKGSLRKATFCRPTRVPALPEAFAKFLYVNFGATMGRGGAPTGVPCTRRYPAVADTNRGQTRHVGSNVARGFTRTRHTSCIVRYIIIIVSSRVFIVLAYSRNNA